MESETDDNCYERKDIPVDGFSGDFYHSRDVTTRQLATNNRHHQLAPELLSSPANVRPISLPAKLSNADRRDELDGAGSNAMDSSSLIRRYAEVTKFKQETTTGSGIRLSKGPDCSPLAMAKKRLSALHTSTAQQNETDPMDDDMMPLLSSNRELSQEELYESHTSLVSSSEGGIMAEGEETSSDESQQSNSSANPAAIVMSLLERLLRSHPVWFLPGIQRSGAIHLLQGKEEGTFIVRGSSQSKTMAVSVRLPANTGPYIEHYLIQSNNGQLSLESSRFKFDSIPALIAHYTQCCDELPVQLCLPVALREAKNRQQLSSLALLGQEFWRYPMASSPKPKPTTVSQATVTLPPLATPSATSSHMNTPSEATHSSGIGISVLNHTPSGSGAGVGNGAGPPMVSAFGETPTDTFSTLSSFTVSNGHTLLSPESIDSAIMMSPMDPQQTGIIGKTSTFKARKQQITSPTTSHHLPQQHHHQEVEKQIELFNANILGGGTSNGDTTGGDMTSSTTSSTESRQGDGLTAIISTLERKPRAPRPTPPNTLNIKPIRSPPAPPARRMKPPVAENSPTAERGGMFTPQQETGFTPTTGFPTRDTAFQRRELPVSIAGTSINTVGPTVSNTVWYCDNDTGGGGDTTQQQLPEAANEPPHHKPETVDLNTSFSSVPASTTRVSRRNKRKESKHYQESDILESPSVYCRSTLVDKISDYEDIWTQDASKSERRSLLGSRHGIYGHEDLTLKGLVSPSIESMSYRQGKLSSYRGPTAHGVQTFSVDNLAVGMGGGHDSASDRASTPTDKPTNRPPVALKTFSPVPKPDDGGRFGGGRSMLPSTDVRQRSCLNISHTTPIAGTPVTLEDVLGGGQEQHKQTSPFYADPADILSNIIRRSPLNRLASSNSSQRRSEPPKQLFGTEDLLPVAGVHPWGNGNGCNVNNNFAISLDELALEKNDSMLSGVRMHELSIAGGSSGHGTNDYDSDIRWKTPSASLKTIEPVPKTQQLQRSTDSLIGRPVTIHQIIARKLPALNLSERLHDGMLANDSSNLGESGFGTLGTRTQRKSAYDNVERHTNAYASSAINSAHSDDGTVFSEPWDSSQWDSFLPNEQPPVDASNVYDNGGTKENRCRKDTQQPQHQQALPQQQQKVATILRSRSCRDREVLCHPRNRTSHSGPGESIATYALYLASKPDSTFSRNISNFIACTKESKAQAPHPQVVMRNMRQFMSGMKNYLVKHGEGEFAGEVQKARAQLKPDEFLNLDAILEEVMHKLVILPLREHLYGLFVDYYSQSGDVQLIVEKVRSTAGRGPLAFGIKGNVIPPSPTAMRQIATLFVRLQEAELPLAKLDLLLAAVSTIFEATTCCNGQQLSADDFLPVLVMVVAHCGFIGAEIEAEYMWGLLQPSLLSGEAGYYLTALCSAVHVLKNFSLSEQEGTATLDWDSSTMPNCSSVLRVIIPDEYNGSIQTRTLPIRPHTTTKEVCRIIAHKARITNAQDYGLFKLIDGEETLLHDTECPQDVRMAAKGKHFMIAYKRIDAKIAWPTVMPNNAATNNNNNNTMTTSTTNTNNAIITTTTTNTTTATASDNQLKV